LVKPDTYTIVTGATRISRTGSQVGAMQLQRMGKSPRFAFYDSRSCSHHTCVTARGSNVTMELNSILHAYTGLVTHTARRAFKPEYCNDYTASQLRQLSN
jgi:hypothetical protein